MTPLDAARLLLAVAGSTFVKDSLSTLDGFSALVPVAFSHAGRRRRPKDLFADGQSLEDSLATMIGDLAVGRLGGAAYARRETAAGSRCMAVTLISAVTEKPYSYPRMAVLRRFGHKGVASVTAFSRADFLPDSLDADGLAGAWPELGLVQVRELPAWSIAEIARAVTERRTSR
ncbi:hypothetical protein M2175_004019 [Bradyrhizobium elkanii]|uniref:hypothetical protein n=1 Tax=Bradyrhizobium TaxID=374 RepID=UPI0021696657|nr:MULTISPECIES: hypothetical protein [Bradyrhizobium]MCS3928988.1 hypothetical protein [Bradyrhizobium elkanii]MCS3969544.1 hypothetical protein [Bradyrhizobium japonicum]